MSDYLWTSITQSIRVIVVETKSRLIKQNRFLTIINIPIWNKDTLLHRAWFISIDWKLLKIVHARSTPKTRHHVSHASKEISLQKLVCQLINIQHGILKHSEKQSTYCHPWDALQFVTTCHSKTGLQHHKSYPDYN